MCRLWLRLLASRLGLLCRLVVFGVSVHAGKEQVPRAQGACSDSLLRLHKVRLLNLHVETVLTQEP